MKLSLTHLTARNLAVGNYRLQDDSTYVPSNTFNALHDRGLVGYFFRSDGYTKIAFLTDKGKALVAEKPS